MAPMNTPQIDSLPPKVQVVLREALDYKLLPPPAARRVIREGAPLRPRRSLPGLALSASAGLVRSFEQAAFLGLL
jgi:hypothetical protein